MPHLFPSEGIDPIDLPSELNRTLVVRFFYGELKNGLKD